MSLWLSRLVGLAYAKLLPGETRRVKAAKRPKGLALRQLGRPVPSLATQKRAYRRRGGLPPGIPGKPGGIGALAARCSRMRRAKPIMMS